MDNVRMSLEQGTHPSVCSLLAAAGGIVSPVQAIRHRARAFVREVVDTVGWDGPPYNPCDLASYRGFQVKASYSGFTSDQDACITPGRILINASKPRVRQRYSIAHEIVHTFFPDYEEELRRAKRLWRRADDESQVERLCQTGASELLLPEFAFRPRVEALGVSLATVITLAYIFDSSIEATARRMVELAPSSEVLAFLRPVDATDGYSPYLKLTVARAYTREDQAAPTPPPRGDVPKTSVAYKAWKRAGSRSIASDTYAAREVWHTVTTPVDCACEAMVLPRNSKAPEEVLCLLRIGA